MRATPVPDTLLCRLEKAAELGHGDLCWLWHTHIGSAKVCPEAMKASQLQQRAKLLGAAGEGATGLLGWREGKMCRTAQDRSVRIPVQSGRWWRSARSATEKRRRHQEDDRKGAVSQRFITSSRGFARTL